MKYNEKMKSFTSLLVLLCSFLWFSLLAHAQGVKLNPLSASIKLSPELPPPHSEVRARLVSFAFDEDRAFIEWLLNGKRLGSGEGLKEVVFTVGSGGSVSILKVIASPQQGGAVEREVEIRPQVLDLLVEARSFIPPWYKGARVATPSSLVRVTALAHFVFEGRALRPETLIYAWQINDEIRGDLSGRGKQSLTFLAPPAARQTKISLTVSSPLKTLEAHTETMVNTDSPELLFYQRRPLEGLITSLALSSTAPPAGAELLVEAVPFFANVSSLGELQFLWEYGGEQVAPIPETPSVLAVREAPENGSAMIVLTVRNLKNTLETIRSSLRIYGR
jgi:hypothetical protein